MSHLAYNVGVFPYSLWCLGLHANIFCAARYFRPPYGTLGARTIERLTALVGSPAYSVGWSVDIEDWIYAESETPEKQFDAFVRDLVSGGNLAVFHYLHPSTVEYLLAAIKVVKEHGLDIMRVDQCMEDSSAPAFRPRKAKKGKGRGRKGKSLTSEWNIYRISSSSWNLFSLLFLLFLMLLFYLIFVYCENRQPEWWKVLLLISWLKYARVYITK